MKTRLLFWAIVALVFSLCMAVGASYPAAPASFVKVGDPATTGALTGTGPNYAWTNTGGYSTALNFTGGSPFAYTASSGGYGVNISRDSDGWTTAVSFSTGSSYSRSQTKPYVQPDLDLSTFSSVKYQLWEDTNGDGVVDHIRSTGTMVDGNATNLPVPNAAWELKAVSGDAGDGVVVALNQTIASGGGGAVATPTPSISYTAGDQIEVVTVDGSGTASTAPLSTGQTTVNGSTTTTYTYNNSAGGSTTVAYGNSGTSAVTAADVRQASAQNSAENERILAAINQGTSSIVGAVTGVSPTPSPTATPSPTPTPDPADVGSALADSALSNVPDLPDFSNVESMDDLPAVDVSHDSSFWQVDLGLFGTMNFDPLSNTLVAGLAGWLRAIIVLIITYYVLVINYRNSSGVLMVINTAQPGATLGAVATEASAWLGTAAMVGISVAVRVVIMAALPATYTILSAWSEVGDSFGVSPMWFLGGKSLGPSIVDAVNDTAGNPALGAAISLLDAFFPIDFAIGSAINVFGYFVLCILVALAIGTWIKFFPK